MSLRLAPSANSLNPYSRLSFRPCRTDRLGYSLAGHVNHTLFRVNIAPSTASNKRAGGVLNDGSLKQATDVAFGSLYNLAKEFDVATQGIQGSGAGWLVSFLLGTERVRRCEE